MNNTFIRFSVLGAWIEAMYKILQTRSRQADRSVDITANFAVIYIFCINMKLFLLTIFSLNKNDLWTSLKTLTTYYFSDIFSQTLLYFHKSCSAAVFTKSTVLLVNSNFTCPIQLVNRAFQQPRISSSRSTLSSIWMYICIWEKLSALEQFNSPKYRSFEKLWSTETKRVPTP